MNESLTRLMREGLYASGEPNGREDTQVLPYKKREGVVGADLCVRPVSK